MSISQAVVRLFWTDRVPLVSRLHSRRLRAVILWTSCTTLWLRWSELKTRLSATRATYWYQKTLRIQRNRTTVLWETFEPSFMTWGCCSFEILILLMSHLLTCSQPAEGSGEALASLLGRSLVVCLSIQSLYNQSKLLWSKAEKVKLTAGRWVCHKTGVPADSAILNFEVGVGYISNKFSEMGYYVWHSSLKPDRYICRPLLAYHRYISFGIYVCYQYWLT